MSEFGEDHVSPTVGKAVRPNLLVPIHADSWALALASGYLGGTLKSDPAEDVQSLGKGAIIAFCEKVPNWALQEGESGTRVLLVIEEATATGDA